MFAVVADAGTVVNAAVFSCCGGNSGEHADLLCAIFVTLHFCDGYRIARFPENCKMRSPAGLRLWF